MNHPSTETAQLLANLLIEVKASIAMVPNPLHPVRMRLQAAVDLAEQGHIPRRPLSDSLQREAALVGEGQDAESIEHGDPA